MKKQDLVQILAAYPDDTEVCITDWRKHIHHADTEPQGNGIEPEFSVDYIVEDVNKPFIALSFINDDYDESGNRLPFI